MLNWTSKEIVNELILRTHSGFLGWITDAVVGIYIRNVDKGVVDLVVFYREAFSSLEKAIVYNEVLVELNDLYRELGIKKINFSYFTGLDSMPSFRGARLIDLSNYFPIFIRYEPQDYDDIPLFHGNDS